MNFALKTRNSELKTRNCVSKTRNSVSKLMNISDLRQDDHRPPAHHRRQVLRPVSAARFCGPFLRPVAAARFCGPFLRPVSAARFCGPFMRPVSAARFCGPFLRFGFFLRNLFRSIEHGYMRGVTTAFIICGTTSSSVIICGWVIQLMLLSDVFPRPTTRPLLTVMAIFNTTASLFSLLSQNTEVSEKG